MNQVQMAAKLYEHRDAAKTLLGVHYERDMQMLADLIRADSKAKNCSDLAAAVALVNEKPGDGFRAVVILAAYVEMTEPSSNASFSRGTAEGGDVGLNRWLGL